MFHGDLHLVKCVQRFIINPGFHIIILVFDKKCHIFKNYSHCAHRLFSPSCNTLQFNEWKKLTEIFCMSVYLQSFQVGLQCSIYVPSLECLKLPSLIVQAQFAMEISSVEPNSCSRGLVARRLIHSVTYTLSVLATWDKFFLGFQQLVRKSMGLLLSACSCLGFRGLSLDLCIEPLLAGQLN